ncbi:hypothetical protein [Streptomyces clavifer]|uniref:hypothetical protein n=1 Tax=Streptomyces clavifer TaxID=68188 RepID=UPI0036BE42B3
MAQPPIEVSTAGDDELNITVAGAQPDEATAFSPTDVQSLLTRIHAQYGAGA